MPNLEIPSPHFSTMYTSRLSLFLDDAEQAKDPHLLLPGSVEEGFDKRICIPLYWKVYVLHCWLLGLLGFWLLSRILCGVGVCGWVGMWGGGGGEGGCAYIHACIYFSDFQYSVVNKKLGKKLSEK